jgi:hypothetical protein
VVFDQAKPRDDAKPGPYITSLGKDDEERFQKWIKDNKIPWREEEKSDYDMRGYWQAQQKGDPEAKRGANLHFPDTYKTPYHVSFSNESKYATKDAPHWVEKSDRYELTDKGGKVVRTEKK